MVSLRGLLGALCLCVCLVGPSAHASAPDYRLRVRLDLDARALYAQADIRLGRAALELRLDRRFALDPSQLDRGAGPLPVLDQGGYWSIRVPAGPAGRRLRLSWRGRGEAVSTGQRHRDTLRADTPVIDVAGSFLPAGSLWYPLPFADGTPVLHAYRIDIDAPAPQIALAPGRLELLPSRGGRQPSRVRMAQAGEGADLIAGPYILAQRRHRSRDGRALVLRTLLHSDIAALGHDYLDSVQRYIELYERWIGPYPYADFSVVSSPTPTGFGMPTLTYLGVDVLRLPFIRHTSLGHEVLHNWWGNGVYPDPADGNWSEGLTTFMADYAYKERGPDAVQAARQMRMAWLRALSAAEASRPGSLAEFRSRSHGASQAIGYNKAAMLFYMLRSHLGSDAFDRGLRTFWRQWRFRRAGWDALRGALEAAAGQSLGDRFDPWVQRAGLARPRLEAMQRHGTRLTLRFSQPAPGYRLDLPVLLRHARGEQRLIVALSGTTSEAVLELPVGLREAELLFDPEFELLRELAPGEAPPVLGQVFIDARSRVVVAGRDPSLKAAAHELATALLEQPFGDETAPGGPLLVLGAHADIDAWLSRQALPGRAAQLREGEVQAWAQRDAEGRMLALVSAPDAAALLRVGRNLPHHGQQGWVVFDQGRSVGRGQWPARPATVRLPD